MKWKQWNALPDAMKNDKVRPYYDILQNKRAQLILKRIFDIVFSLIALVLFSPIMLALAILIKLDTKGTVFFRQVRVTQYAKEFRICKFRTMVPNAEALGTQVTAKNDMRVTKIGRLLRRYRLDEIPQLFNIISGDMTFVGTRPEVPKYVNHYKEEMLATLLLPAGVTSKASIEYKDEERLLANTNDAESVYINEVLPQKMKYNLEAIEKFNILDDTKIIIRTAVAVAKND